MRAKRKGRRFGTYLFIVPLLVISVVVAYQLINDYYYPQTGTFSVNAQSSAKYYHAVGLNVTASVGSRNGVTPFTLSLTQGAYTVTFPALTWYSSPQPRDVSVVAGRTAYAVGVYDPVVDYVAISQSQFNTTRIIAMHGVTPVVWLNQMGENVAILSDPTGLVTILPNQNFTFVFPAFGSYSVRLPQFNSSSMVVNVQ
jgi:hypothetical protein